MNEIDVAGKLEEEIILELEDLQGTDEPMELDEYRTRVEMIEKLTKVSNDVRKRHDEKEAKEQQLKSEEKRQKTDSGIKLFMFGVTTGVSVWSICKTFIFDGEKIVTSTLGRSILQNSSNLFKRQ